MNVAPQLQVTIWMNMPSFYQADLFRALVASGEVDLQVVFARDLPSERVQLGWKEDLQGFSYCFLDRRRPLRHILRLIGSQRERLHVVNGVWAESAFAAALVALGILRARYAIYSEASDPGVRRPATKRLFQRALGKVVVRRAAGVLPISHLAEEAFARLGTSARRMYPFGYFRSAHQGAPNRRGSRGRDQIDVTFVGQLTARKGPDLLLEAMAPLFREHPALMLSLIGAGDLMPALQERVTAAGLARHVRFEGVIPAATVPTRLADSDLLVLPSRWDGWGLVINEALSVGVPVLVSDRCGACDLVQDGISGYVFRSGDVTDLRSCLKAFLSRGPEWPQLRNGALAMGSRISTEAMAPYLIRCLQHMAGLSDRRPAPPWAAPGTGQAIGR